ncbi:MAG TPA: TlyA family rRNA (cytidine-2'-O)-methyltransferase [Alphaproteobacteria bacterium]|mgnify:FL=1|nr:TlyA family rRNA (cytidine-2'-O)-methyltransferase [Alphaproteobacteria bacterium]
MKKQRADVLLVAQGLAENQAKAAALIMEGQVCAAERRIEKAGEMLKPETQLRLKSKAIPWVSRGGFKLVKGLSESGFDPAGLVCLDVGCSTGGFTDVLLHNGAKKVYAVDVGYGQLAQKLRVDSRVVVLERTNAKYLTKEQIPEPVGMIVCDASFIGLRTVLDVPLSFADPNGAYLIALIKPQFEVEKYQVGEGGIVRDPALHKQVCDDMRDWLSSRAGWTVAGIVESPIKGAEGNTEFLLLGRFSG